MGCCHSSTGLFPNAPEEERLIIFNEMRLNYEKSEVTRMFEFLRANSTEGQLDGNQFSAFISSFQLTVTDIDTQDTKLQQFYKRFRDSKKKYDLEKLAILSVLLGKGTVRDKAEVYFKACPFLDGGTVSADGIKEFLATIFEISVIALPELAVEEVSQPGRSITKVELDVYIRKLKTGCEAVLQRCYNALVTTNQKLTSRDFVERMSSDDTLSKLASSSGVRRLLLEESTSKSKPLPKVNRE